MSTLAGGRIGIAAQATGILAACLDESVKFAKERIAFGKPIGAFEGVSFKIAQMATDLDAARLLVYRAAALADAGKPFATEASKAKLFASTAARRHASEALQIHGGYGYTTEFPGRTLLSRRKNYRDLRRHLGNPAHHHRAVAAGKARVKTMRGARLDASHHVTDEPILLPHSIAQGHRRQGEGDWSVRESNSRRSEVSVHSSEPPKRPSAGHSHERHITTRPRGRSTERPNQT